MKRKKKTQTEIHMMADKERVDRRPDPILGILGSCLSLASCSQLVFLEILGVTEKLCCTDALSSEVSQGSCMLCPWPGDNIYLDSRKKGEMDPSDIIIWVTSP